MLHTKTPEDDGWYWVESPDGYWYMARLNLGGDYEAVSVADRLFDDFVSQPLTWPRRWIGPLQCPAGDFGSFIAEFTAEDHERAAKEKKALVMTHADLTYCQLPGGTMTTFGVMDEEEAMRVIARRAKEKS